LKFSFYLLFKKEGSLFGGPLLSYMISYLYTKIPLFLSAIKKEEKRREDIIVYNIHFFLLLAYKSNLFFIKQIKNQENILK